MRRVFVAFVTVVVLWTATAWALEPFDPAGIEGGCSCAYVRVDEPDDTLQVFAAALVAAAIILLLAIRRR